MKNLFAMTVVFGSLTCAALTPEITDFWDTTKYENPVTSSASATGQIAYDGVIKTVAVKVCEFFSTIPNGLMLLFR